MQAQRLFFDSQDHTLVNFVASFLQLRAQGRRYPLPVDNLHPHGIVEMSVSHPIRIATALITLLDSLSCGDSETRLKALQRLHDEVLHSAHSSLRANTGRVLLQLMKDLVRSCSREKSLMLAHDFHAVLQGAPRLVRRLLRRYHLLEMPEAWNQQTFDHHVHDSNSRGRKNPTHLVMDAWIKGIRFLTVVYYNRLDADAADELFRAARIMGITVRMGMELRTEYRGRFIDVIWSPLECSHPAQVQTLLRHPQIRALQEDYRPVSHWLREHTLHLLRAWNMRHAARAAASLGIKTPDPLDEDSFLAFVGHRLPMPRHLAEYICLQLIPLLQSQSCGKDDLIHPIQAETIAAAWLSPEANPDLIYPHTPQADMPEILRTPPQKLFRRLAELPAGQIILNLASLTAADVLELLWLGQGRITHLELFNLREWSDGRLHHIEAINGLQRALNEGSSPVVKHCVRKIAKQDDNPDRAAIFNTIQENIPRLCSFYMDMPLGSRIGTDSAGRAQGSHGMGLAFTCTLPPQARRELRRDAGSTRIFLPISTETYRFTQYHQNGETPTGLLHRFCALLPFLHTGKDVVKGWGLEKRTTRVEQSRCLVTLGGIGNGLQPGGDAPPALRALPWRHRLAYLDNRLVNILKILAGFLPAQWAFWYVDSWWFLAWFGALLWFLITGVRNVIQAVLGGGGLRGGLLLSWRSFVHWNRIADSLFYTGISVPLLEVGVRLWLLEDLLGLTVQTHALTVYSMLALINSIYISGHNIFRGLPMEAVIGNLFRSALAIPLSLLMGEGLLQIFQLTGAVNPLELTQTCAAITAKCASDTVAAVIEGFADRNLHMRLRRWDYSSKLDAVFRNFARQEMLFPKENMADWLNRPQQALKMLKAAHAATAQEALINMLDLLYFWYYQPRARQVFSMELQKLSPEEQNVLCRLHRLLSLETEISSMLIDGMAGRNFAASLHFYLKKNREYRLAMLRLLPRHVRHRSCTSA